MNTFKRPFIFVIIFLGSGMYITVFGRMINEDSMLVLGGIISGISLGIALVNGFPIFLHDKNATDHEWWLHDSKVNKNEFS